ncbi:MAG TPA: hypothetical protein VGL11_20000 [Candidatus Binatia bacterium]|jgi:hypothetical protein
MGKILLIEPHKVLQQAIGLSLFPEHDVQVQDSVTASAIGSLRETDLLIVDAAALRESNQLSPELARELQNSAVPLVWIDDDTSVPPPKRDKLAALTKPIESAAFQSALVALLSPAGAKTVAKKAPPAGEPKSQRKKPRQKADGEPIELVDIVEDEASSEGKAPKS